MPEGSVQTPPPMTEPGAVAQPRLERRLGLLHVTALNMTNMIGMGPFITIPLLMSTINGGRPQCMLGWLVGQIRLARPLAEGRLK